ncbi:unnamed protein product [Darwinula stevensoni]|uniref:KH homology domain-containing protein 4 n=1 Tax=Darwinula stevensoni TaxID=69355 RepID=A0A7R9A959_9CRUS|nr:unnamed protein product [Darwinula stevensoni]CAG0897089.1 unnamed protein product [Darwinula stevensoni]
MMRSAEVEINDAPLPARNVLTRGLTQDELHRETGAAISTRGRFMTPEEKARNHTDRPLYLHVQASEPYALDLAVKKIHEIIGRYARSSHGDPSSKSSYDSLQQSLVMGKILQAKVFVGIDVARAESLQFDVRGKILGTGGSNIQYIASETGATVKLTGNGCGEEASNEALHLLIEHAALEKLEQAKDLALNLVETVGKEFVEHEKTISSCPPPPHLSTASSTVTLINHLVPPNAHLPLTSSAPGLEVLAGGGSQSQVVNAYLHIPLMHPIQQGDASGALTSSPLLIQPAASTQTAVSGTTAPAIFTPVSSINPSLMWNPVSIHHLLPAMQGLNQQASTVSVPVAVPGGPVQEVMQVPQPFSMPGVTIQAYSPAVSSAPPVSTSAMTIYQPPLLATGLNPPHKEHSPRGKAGENKWSPPGGKRTGEKLEKGRTDGKKPRGSLSALSVYTSDEEESRNSPGPKKSRSFPQDPSQSWISGLPDLTIPPPPPPPPPPPTGHVSPLGIGNGLMPTPVFPHAQQQQQPLLPCPPPLMDQPPFLPRPLLPNHPQEPQILGYQPQQQEPSMVQQVIFPHQLTALPQQVILPPHSTMGPPQQPFSVAQMTGSMPQHHFTQAPTQGQQQAQLLPQSAVLTVPPPHLQQAASGGRNQLFQPVLSYVLPRPPETCML